VETKAYKLLVADSNIWDFYKNDAKQGAVSTLANYNIPRGPATIKEPLLTPLM